MIVSTVQPNPPKSMSFPEILSPKIDFDIHFYILYNTNKIVGWVRLMIEISESRERVLDAAERLFAERGYGSVTIKDIAKAAGIHHASLYHHVPGGKEQMFVEVMERNLVRHQQGIEAAIAAAGNDLRGQLIGIASWLLSQPPMDFIRMVRSDLPAIQRDAADRLANLAYDGMLIPVERVLRQAQERGEVRHRNIGLVAGAIFSSVEGLHTIPDEYLETSRLEMAKELIDVFLRGIAP